MIIDEIMLNQHGGRLHAGYTISGVSMENSYHRGVGQSDFTLLKQDAGLKSINITVTFLGSAREEIDRLKSLFEMRLMGKNDLVLDGNYYSVICQEIGNANYKGFGACEVEYQFLGYKHGPLQTITGNHFYCASTLPHTDCRITVTASKDASTYKVGTVTFFDVSSGDVLVVDGLDKRILVNEAPAAQKADWLRFPSLVPGENVIICDDTVTVEYYPVYF